MIPNACPNVEFCGETDVSRTHNGVCIHCTMHFGGRLTRTPRVECPVCYETAPGVTLDKCAHVLCGPCFRTVMAPWLPHPTPQPPFPIPEWESEWEDTPDDEKWLDIPAVQFWLDEVDDWDAYPDTLLRSAPYLGRCPVCRCPWMGWTRLPSEDPWWNHYPPRNWA
jgi:hypothetical protein